MFKAILTCLLSLLYIGSIAQNLRITQVEFLNNRLVIKYDLTDSVENRYYSVRLYTSADGFLNAMEKVEGDVGLQLKAGKDRTVVWSPVDELSSTYEGKIVLEMRARIFTPFIITESLNQHRVFKRKRSYNITWSGGTPQNVLNFNLMKGDKKVMSFPNIANVGHHAFVFPGYIKPGKNYYFIIGDAKNKDEQVTTSKFRIKRKIPLLVKAIPLVIVGGGVYMIISNRSETEADIELPVNPNSKP